MQLNIGSIKLPHAAVLAPMSGITDQPFRRIVRSLGGGLVVSEMIASHAILNSIKKKLESLNSLQKKRRLFQFNWPDGSQKLWQRQQKLQNNLAHH